MKKTKGGKLMSTQLSSRMKNISASATTALFARVDDMKISGIDVISLNVGEPDFPTPENIKAAGIKAIEDDFTKYTNARGIAPLREAILKKVKEDNGAEYTMDEVTVTTGAKQSLSAALMAVVGDGDEVIIPVPCYVSYPDIVRLAGGTPVFVRRNDDFSLDLEAIAGAVTSNTKAIIICSPDNPTGAVYSEESLRKLADIAVENDFFIVSDEIYEKIIFSGNKHFSLSSIPEIRDRVILVNGFSKTYSMTGWRLGYLCARKDVISNAVKVQSQTTTTPPSISQIAAVEALTGPQDSVSEMVAEFEKRKDFVVKELNAIPGVKCHDIQGAFYAFFDLRSYIGSTTEDGKVIENDSMLCEYLLENSHVAIMPGSAYFAPGYARISFASSMEVLKKALQRIKLGLNALKC